MFGYYWMKTQTDDRAKYLAVSIQWIYVSELPVTVYSERRAIIKVAVLYTMS